MNLAFYSNLIGKDVSYLDDEGNSVSTKVKSVTIENGAIMLKTDSGSTIDPTLVTEVK